MQFEVLQNLFLNIFIGIVLGFILTRYYYEKTRNFALGKTIEGILISRNIEELIYLSEDLNGIIEKLRLESDGLLEQIKKSRNIETYSYDDEIIEKTLSINPVYEETSSNTEKQEKKNIDGLQENEN